MGVDLQAEAAELWGSLGAPAPGRARTVQFVAARSGEGASTVAREFARYAVRRATRAVWLIDLDLTAGGQHAAISADAARYGDLGPAATASPDGSMFLAVQPPARGADGKAIPDSRYVAAYNVGGKPLWITRFRVEMLRGRQRAHIVPGADYWSALRQHAELIVVDCPAAERSEACLTLAPYMDQTVLVVSADQPDVRPPGVLRDAVTAAGGRCAGLFFNRASVQPPAFLRKLMP